MVFINKDMCLFRLFNQNYHVHIKLFLHTVLILFNLYFQILYTKWCSSHYYLFHNFIIKNNTILVINNYLLNVAITKKPNTVCM